MKKILFCLMFVSIMMFSMVYAKDFTDVDSNHWAYEYITELSDQGVINGYEDGSFRPNGTITEAEFIKLLVSTCLKADVDVSMANGTLNHWAKNYIKIAENYGLLKPYEMTEAQADHELKRIQMAFLLSKANMTLDDETGKISGNVFQDGNTMEEVYADIAEYALQHGLVTGYAGNSESNLYFRPYLSLTRAEAATVIFRFIHKYPDKKWKDVGALPHDILNENRRGILKDDCSTINYKTYNHLFIFNNRNIGFMKQDIAVISLREDGIVPEDAIISFDVSKNLDCSVIAYISPSIKYNNFFKLTIVSNGKIRASKCDYLFAGYTNCKEINGLEHLDTIGTTSMEGMFKGNAAKEVDLSSLNTSHVTNMSEMFAYCDITNYHFDGFNTSNVTDMSWMFTEATGKKLDVGSFDLTNVKNMTAMFRGANFEELSFENCNTKNVINMSSLFYEYRNANINLKGLDTSNVEDMSWMFYGCQFDDIDFSFLDTSKVKKMNTMFCGVKASKIDLSHFDTKNVTDMELMFFGCNCAIIDVSSFDTSNVTNMKQMFYKCDIGKLNMRGFSFKDVSQKDFMFENSHFDTIIVKSKQEKQDLLELFPDTTITVKK